MAPLTHAERNRRWRARRRGEKVPPASRGPKPKDYFAPPTPEEIVERLLRDARLQPGWDGVIAADADYQSEARKTMERLLAMVRKDAE